MAASVPASLKNADVTRFALRAAQLDKAKPVIAYYCKYQIVNTILGKGLHNSDEESIAYTTHLMDQLEQFKIDNKDNDAVTDDLAGKVYVEQFGLETFQRADNAMRAKKASRQTADTFQAAATFLDLLHIWGEVDPEITSKILFAKVHAVRILKALKAGEDPNIPDPTSEAVTPHEESVPAIDPNDPDVQAINSASERSQQPSVVEVPDEADRLQKRLAPQSVLDESLHPSRASSIPRPPESKPRQPSVTEVPDEADRLQARMAPQSSLDESLHPSRAPSIPPSTQRHDISPPAPSDPSSFYTSGDQAESSQFASDDQPAAASTASERRSSIGGNYFPQVPSPFAQPPPASLDIPSAPVNETGSPIDLPTAPAEPALPDTPSVIGQAARAFIPPPHQASQPHSTIPPPTGQPGQFLPQSSAIPPSLPSQSAPRHSVPQAPPQSRQQPAPAPAYTPAPAPAPLEMVVDEEAMMAAQKHARWAISALNFEDVPTAIKELRSALETLGAR